jgi:hypothetical protein
MIEGSLGSMATELTLEGKLLPMAVQLDPLFVVRYIAEFVPTTTTFGSEAATAMY